MLYIRQLFHNAVHCEIAISYEKIPTSFHCYPINKYACIFDKKKVQQKKQNLISIFIRKFSTFINMSQ